MYPQLGDCQVTPEDSGKTCPKLQESMLPPGRAETASPPPVDASDDSLPLSDLSNSPSPTTGRRMSLLSDVSVSVVGPFTPSKRLFEDVIVNNAPNRAVEYQRIHSTPYPKPRLPTQLTPHPQARVVSLPEYSRNRNPFLESLRNPRSVSSPARLKPAPLSPIYHEAVEEVESSMEASEHSSASVLPPHHFPAVADLHQLSSEASQPYQLDPSYVSRNQSYAAPHSLYFTPPSFKSLSLSPFTAGPERSLPIDRPLVAEQDKLYLNQDSEGEVSMMLHQMSLNASCHPARSSVAASTGSHVSSPESSVVFLSPTTKIPYTFLGTRPTTGASTHRSTPSLEPILQEPESPTYLDSDHDNPHSKRLSLSEKPGLVRPKKEDHDPEAHRGNMGDTSTRVSYNIVPHVPIDSKNEQDWILFEEPPKPIPALHGPPSLPYARCPSGAEGVILDGTQPPDDLVWGLTEDTHSYPRLGHCDTQGTETYHQLGAKSTDLPTYDAVSHSWTPIHRETIPATNTVGQPIPSCVKEKHVRFLDDQTSRAASQSASENVSNVVPQLRSSSAAHGLDVSGTSGSTTENLARLLQEQLQRTRATKNQLLERAKVPTSQETLDQLRRFGVPFRPHVTASTHVEHRAPGTRFQFVTRSESLADLLASQNLHKSTQERPLLSRDSSQSLIGSNGFPNSAPQFRSTEPWATGSHPLSNAKSIPLLRLRQRQNEESQRMQLSPTEETPDRYPRSSDRGDTRDQKQTLSELRSSFNSSQPASTQASAKDEDPIASYSSRVDPLPSSERSSNRHRSRKGGKLAPIKPAIQSSSQQKEDGQTTKEPNEAPRKQSFRQPGRKKANQRSRMDNLAQTVSRRG